LRRDAETDNISDGCLGRPEMIRVFAEWRNRSLLLRYIVTASTLNRQPHVETAAAYPAAYQSAATARNISVGAWRWHHYSAFVSTSVTHGNTCTVCNIYPFIFCNFNDAESSRHSVTIVLLINWYGRTRKQSWPNWR
jgi:hypothetical protein